MHISQLIIVRLQFIHGRLLGELYTYLYPLLSLAAAHPMPWSTHIYGFLPRVGVVLLHANPTRISDVYKSIGCVRIYVFGATRNKIARGHGLPLPAIWLRFGQACHRGAEAL
jgi:hypothetical protein